MGHHWIHFVGKSFYSSPSHFAKEAAVHGVSRRVSLQQARAMRHGDRVLLAQWDAARKTSRVFGAFTVESLYGEGLSALFRDGEEVVACGSGFSVMRECGKFTVGGSFVCPVDIPELLARVDEQHPVSTLMVGGMFEATKPYQLKDIAHRQGFRRIDAEGLARAVEEGFQRAECPVIRGQFYVWDDTSILTMEEQAMVDGLVYEIEHYERK